MAPIAYLTTVEFGAGALSTLPDQRNIDAAYANGGDVAVRSEMLMGALEGGLTFQKGLGAVHALSHALGGLRELSLHHGTLNASLLPPVLRFNASHVGDTR